MATTTPMPEGTDSVIDDAARDAEFTPDFEATAKESAGATTGDTPESKLKAAFRLVDEKTAGIRQQAFDAGKGYATQGKDRTVGALDGVVKLIDDSATTLDDKLGAQYGDYARKASEQIAGLASSLRGKEVDDLLEDAQAMIRKSPAIAIGVAATAGFLLARLIKAGADAAKETAETLEKDAPTGKKAA